MDQNKFLEMYKNKPCSIYLSSGIRLRGKIVSFDRSSVLLGHIKGEQLIFKQAISTIEIEPKRSR